MGGISHDSLKVASALNFKVMEFQQASSLLSCGSAVPRGRLPAGALQRCDAEVRHSGARSHRLRAVVGAARLHGKLCVTCQHTSSWPPSAGLSVIPRNKDDMGDGVPTDQRSHIHCDCIDGHCSSHMVASCVFALLVPTPTTRRRRRVPSIMSTSPSSSTRASLVSRHISQRYPPRASS